MVDGGSFSYAGNGRSLKRLRRHFMAPKGVLWRRWRLPLSLAVVPTALVTWLGINAAPYLGPLSTGWRAFVVGGVLFACLVFLWYLVDRWRRVKRWAHGPFPPPAGAEKGWYLLEPIRPRRIGLLLVATLTALLQAWVQAVHDGGHTLDGTAAIAAFFFWVGIIRGLGAPGEPAIAVTASGVFNGIEFCRWDEIRHLRMVVDDGEEDIVLTTRNGQRWLLEKPETTLKNIEIYKLIDYYWTFPQTRSGIADAVWPPGVMRA